MGHAPGRARQSSSDRCEASAASRTCAYTRTDSPHPARDKRRAKTSPHGRSPHDAVRRAECLLPADIRAYDPHDGAVPRPAACALAQREPRAVAACGDRAAPASVRRPSHPACAPSLPTPSPAPTGPSSARQVRGSAHHQDTFKLLFYFQEMDHTHGVLLKVRRSYPGSPSRNRCSFQGVPCRSTRRMRRRTRPSHRAPMRIPS